VGIGVVEMRDEGGGPSGERRGREKLNKVAAGQMGGWEEDGGTRRG
jgi:hypothetical protein